MARYPLAAKRATLVDSRTLQAAAARDGEAAPPASGSTLRNAGVYAAAAAFQRGIIFLLLPVYTRVLDPAAYGRLSVLLAISAVAIILLSGGMDAAFFRSYFALRASPETQGRFVTTVWLFLLVVPPIAAALVTLVAAPFLASNQVVPIGEFALALAGAAVCVSGTVVPLALLRAEERLRAYVVFTAVTGVTTAAFTLIAVVAVDGGVTGWLGAVVAANLVTLVVAVRLIPLRLSTGIDRSLLVSALALGLPLIPHVLSQWGLGVSNRVVLVTIVSTSEVGIYALAANVALPLAIVMQSMGAAFMPTYARAATEEAAFRSLPQAMMAQFLMVLVLTMSGALIGPIAVAYLAPPEYAPAARLVPWIAAGYGLLGLYFLPMNAVVLIEGRTGKVWIATLIAALVSLSSLPLLVPLLDLLGAAIAVTIGYGVLLVGVSLYSRGPNNPVRYEWGRLLRAATVFVVVYLLAVATTGDRTAADLCFRLTWMCVVPPLLVLTRVIDGQRAITGARRLRTRGPGSPVD